MSKIINIDSSLSNADWTKHRKLDAEGITNVQSLLQFLQINKKPEMLTEGEIKSIMKNSWFSSVPVSLRNELFDMLENLETKRKNAKL